MHAYSSTTQKHGRAINLYAKLSAKTLDALAAARRKGETNPNSPIAAICPTKNPPRTFTSPSFAKGLVPHH